MRNGIIWAATILAGVGIVYHGSTASAFASTRAEIAAADPQKPKTITVPAGTRILIRMIDSIDSSKQKTGFRFSGTLETNLQAVNVVVAPRGTKVFGKLISASSAGKMSGSSELTLELTDIMMYNSAYPLLTSTYEIKGAGEGGNTAKKVIGGAGLGALIGGIAGGGKGAGIGALVGVAGGTAIAASKKGEQLLIPSESLIEFRLQQPAILPAGK
jgi:hypothetical protein